MNSLSMLDHFRVICDPTGKGCVMSGPAETAVTSQLSVMSGMVLLAGPILGPWLAVLVAAFIGSFWSMGKYRTESRAKALFMIFRIITTACLLAGVTAYLVADYLEDDAAEFLLPACAFLIAALGDKLESLKDALSKRLHAVVGGSES